MYVLVEGGLLGGGVGPSSTLRLWIRRRPVAELRVATSLCWITGSA
jgi:hypothetical protein